ncbi:bromodomain-containing protein 2-like [Leptopilina heterotoma]|uniref:bromodomain-containing protein 2-like n=1 Tax=Leptopilina heterotoma TaxID=63436 RepID=UPI001CA9FC76|nr:bromodomain-containing protein 2-like [Leptopilina heterotoma]
MNQNLNQREQSNALKACKEILEELLSEKHVDYAWPFYQEFSKELTDIIHKNQGTIETPMNFQIIKSKMDNHEYKVAHEFATDVRLMCKNCSNMEFLPSLVVISKKLHQVFETLYRNIIDESSRKLAQQIGNLIVMSNNAVIACSFNENEFEPTVCCDNCLFQNKSVDSDSDSDSSCENLEID